MLPKTMRRPAHRLIIAVALAGVSACSDPLDSSEKPDIALAYMQLTVEADYPMVATLANRQAVEFMVPRGTSSITIKANWLNATRQLVPDAATRELKFSFSGAAFTEVAGARDGVLSGLTSGLNVVRISVSRSGDGQQVFEVTLNITVNPNCGDCWE